MSSSPVYPLLVGLAKLRELGIALRPGYGWDEITFSWGDEAEEGIEMSDLLYALGGDSELVGDGHLCDAHFYLDTECIYDAQDYVTVLKRLAGISGGELDLAYPQASIGKGRTWVEFDHQGQRVHWDLKYAGDWIDGSILQHMQQLALAHNPAKAFLTSESGGQDLLLTYGDETFRQSLVALSGVEFKRL